MIIMAEEENKPPAPEAAPPAGAAPAGAAEKPAAGKKKGGKKVEKKGKRVRTGKKHLKSDVYKFYKIEDGKAVTSKKPCPRCGPGTWLAEHKGRKYCGRCSYTIFEKK